MAEITIHKGEPEIMKAGSGSDLARATVNAILSVCGWESDRTYAYCYASSSTVQVYNPIRESSMSAPVCFHLDTAMMDLARFLMYSKDRVVHHKGWHHVKDDLQKRKMPPIPDDHQIYIWWNDFRADDDASIEGWAHLIRMLGLNPQRTEIDDGTEVKTVRVYFESSHFDMRQLGIKTYAND
jgi:hypothetical protein